MRKSEIDIKDDIYDYIVSTEIPAVVSGHICKRKRPLNSKAEDVCVSVVSSDYSDNQQAIVNVNIYIPQVYNDSTKQYEQDTPRVRTLARLSGECLESVMYGDMYFTLERQSVYETESKESVISNRLLYKHNTE